jgi:DHA3 family macrolide efflux protein-like MFS transporter
VVLYLAGQTLSLFGSAVVGYAVIWYIALETGSAVRFALLALAAVLPTGLVALPGGVWADRYSRKLLVIGADAAIAIITVGMAALFWLDWASWLALAGCLLLRSALAGVHTPAEAAILPQITPPEHLLRVNAINSSIQSASLLIAPALAAVLLVWWEMSWILLLDVVTAAAAITILARLAIPPPPGAGEERRHVWAEIGAGVKTVLRVAVLRRTMWLGLVVYTLIMPAAMLTPIVVVKLFGGEPWQLAAVEIAYSGAMILGGAVLAAWGGLSNRMTMMLVGAVLWGVFTLAQGLAPGVWTYIILWAAFGLVAPWLTTTSMTVLQEHSPPEALGKVMGVASTVMLLAGPVGMVAIAPLMDLSPDQTPVRLVLIVTGALAVVAAGIAAVGAPPALRPPSVKTDRVSHQEP